MMDSSYSSFDAIQDVFKKWYDFSSNTLNNIECHISFRLYKCISILDIQRQGYIHNELKPKSEARAELLNTIL